MRNEKQYIFGPVPSRRLGLSLGVDIVPFKVCSLDCLYCQVGKTVTRTLRRDAFVPLETVLEQLSRRLEEPLRADYVTVSGSGEPTLNLQLGSLIRRIKQITDIPVAVITNGTLLFMPQVRKDCCEADIVLPSLDAWDGDVFQAVNNPSGDIDFDEYIEGLRLFRQEFSGSIWLEVFLIKGKNDSESGIRKLSGIISTIKPDKVQLNTAVRPTAYSQVERVEPDRLRQFADIIGSECEIIADFSAHRCREAGSDQSGAESVITETLARRPCSFDDICSSVNFTPSIVRESLSVLLASGKIIAECRDNTAYYRTAM